MMNADNNIGLIEKLNTLLPFTSEQAPESNAIALFKRGLWNLFCVTITPIVIPILIIAKIGNSLVNTFIRDRTIVVVDNIDPKITPENSALREPFNDPEKFDVVCATISNRHCHPVSRDDVYRFIIECKDKSSESVDKNAFESAFINAAAKYREDDIIQFYRSWESTRDRQKLSVLRDEIISMPVESNPQYNQLMGENICGKNHDELNRTYEEQTKEIKQNVTELVESGVISKSQAEENLAEGLVFLQYEYERIDYNQALEKLKELSCHRLDAAVDQLNKTRVRKKAYLSSGEIKEFSLYQQVLEIFYKHQIHGDSNCQSFIISLESLFRLNEYKQVRGLNEQIEIPLTNAEASPVPCWNNIDERIDFLHGFNPDFKETVILGQRTGYRPENDRTEDAAFQLRGNRYVILKHLASGGAGHFFMAVRSKSTGRFFAIDGQNRRIFPILNPDYNFTYQSQDVFNNSNVYALRIDRIKDDEYLPEEKKSLEVLDKKSEEERRNLLR